MTSQASDAGDAGHSERDEAARPISWTEAEPGRLARDREEVPRFAPEVVYRDPDSDPSARFRHGGWSGELPRWPFDRPQPSGLGELIGPRGLLFTLEYSAAHPMLPPTIYPMTPEPEVAEQTQATWHVAPGGSLCLLQSEGAWQPEASITELLSKAAGWRIEYALMKSGVIERMSVNGIVSDDSYDHLIAAAVQRRISSDPEDAQNDIGHLEDDRVEGSDVPE